MRKTITAMAATKIAQPAKGERALESLSVTDGGIG
jgi:hypothetical protein